MNSLETLTPDLTDPQSVVANRRGELTPAQQARLTNPVTALGGMDIGFLGLNLLRQAAHLQQDLHAPEIQCATGQLVLEDHGYMADISDRRLSLPPNRGRLLPGVTYQFYYLAGSGAVLSAEEIQALDEVAAREHLTDILAQANQYALSSLEANRQGQLTGEQAARLYKSFFQGLLVTAFAAAVSALFLITFLAPPQMDLLVRLLGVGFAVWGGGLFVVGGLGQALRAAFDLLANQVECVEGPAQKKVIVSRTRSSRGSKRRRANRRFYYLIGAQCFQVSERAYHALIEDLPHRLYYTPRSKQLVSIEPLTAPASQTSSQ